MRNFFGIINRKRLCCLSILLLPLFAGCREEHKEYRIGVSQPSSDDWRSQMNEEIRREILFHENAEVEIRSADDDSRRQIEDIDYFARNGFDLVIVSPNEAEEVTPAVRALHRRGTPVIVFDRALTDSSFTTYIDLDNVSIGEEAARYAAEAVKRRGGAVVELRGLDGSTPAEERHRGFARVIDSIPGINFIGTFNGDWNAAPARRLTDSLLTSNPEIGIIYAQNDVMAIAAAETARKRGRKDITVIGTDGAPKLGMKAVADSLIDVTFIYPTEGDRVIRTAMDILDGKKVERIQHVPALSYIDRDNARMHIRMNEMAAEKTHRLEEMNSLYSMAKSREQAQRMIVYAVSIGAFLLLAIILGLLYFMRQKNRYQKEMAEKNSLLISEKEKREELYAKQQELYHQLEELYHQLEEATQSKLAFYTNVSHDLRTPLALIADPVEKIANESYLPPADRELMRIVTRNVKILRRMIDQILDFRRYENGMTKLTLREADIMGLISEWCSDFTDYARRHGITFTVELPLSSENASRPTIAIDVEKTERIFFNLLSNAFKYTDSPGSVTVAAAMEEDRFVLKVCDTGAGISKEELGKIFDRFYQVNRPRPKGSGIGLSLSKAFAKMMDGDISVESEPGKGSCFTLTIPMRHTEEDYAGVFSGFDLAILNPDIPTTPISPNEETGPDGPTEEEKPLMLVIDDNEDIRSLVRMMSEREYAVIEAADGKEGMRLAMKYLPDVIVCDIMMPDVDGLEVTRRLKEERITSHIPVLILTACRLDEQRVRSYDSGADGFLSKPFTQVMLMARCAALVKNRRRIYDLLLEDGGAQSAIVKKERPERNDERQALDNDFYQEFIGWVRKLYMKENLTIGEIADKFGIGATQLTRKIKALTGNTPVEIIRELRLSEARKKLLTTDETVAEIAYSTGFSSSQYFARCFREAYNMTPSELRASVR